MTHLSSHAAMFMLAIVLLAPLATAASAKPEYRPLVHPTVAEMAEGLAKWAEARPQAMRVETVGRTAEGLPMLLCRITDYDTADEDKQVALITTCHAGGELNSATGTLRFIKWLIGDDPKAANIRRKQIVLVMPCCDPEGFDRERVGNTLGGGPYMAWTWDGVADPEKNPEALAIKRVMDEYQPDIHCDVHGVWMEQQTMWESTGISWAAGLSRSYLHDIPRLMDRAAEREGFLITRGEQDAGQVRATAPVEGAEDHFYISHGGVNDCVYSYHNYHTIAFTMEGGFEESVVARLRAMLSLGNRKWRGEPYAGYPAGQIACWTSMAVAAYGTTAAERRRSRVELWRKLRQLRYGCGHPEPRGTMMAFCSTTPKGAAYLKPKNITGILQGLEGVEGFDLDALNEFNQRTPAVNAETAGVGADGEPIRHGLAIRLLIPYRKCRITHLALNGRPLSKSPTDGYQLWRGPGTIVQVNIPPEKVTDLHIVTCAYEENSGRKAGFRPEDWELRDPQH